MDARTVGWAPQSATLFTSRPRHVLRIVTVATIAALIISGFIQNINDITNNKASSLLQIGRVAARITPRPIRTRLPAAAASTASYWRQSPLVRAEYPSPMYGDPHRGWAPLTKVTAGTERSGRTRELPE